MGPDIGASEKIRQVPLDRIAVIGNSGSGKSRLARLMGARLDLPVIHLDRHFFLPGWQERSGSEWAAMLTRFAEGEAWVIDGNHTTYFAARRARADLIVWLDCPVWLSLWRVIRRLIWNYGRVRGDDLAPGCPERFEWAFLVYVARYPRRRAEIEMVLEGAQGRVLRLSNKRQVAAFVAGLSRA